MTTEEKNLLLNDMAAIDKLYVHSYYEYDDLRRWVFAYYPKLLRYMYSPFMSNITWYNMREDWLKDYKRHIEKDYSRLGTFKTKQEAVANLRKYYKESANYDCPLRQAKEEVDYCIKQYEKMQADDFALEDDYTFLVMTTPSFIDKKLQWICPVPCVRKYLVEQCGYKTKWYHKLFWKGKEYFN